MRKLVMLVFMLLSLGTMIGFTVSITDLVAELNLGIFTWESVFEMIKSEPLEDLIPQLGFILWTLFQVYGIPLIVFLVSYNGLMQKTRVIIKKAP